MTIKQTAFCDEHKPEKPEGKPFTLKLSKDDVEKGYKQFPVKCDVCGKQADWLVLKSLA